MGPVLPGAASPLLTLARAPRGTTECRSRSGSTHSTVCEQGAPRPVGASEEAAMEVIHERCCGLDIHKKTVVACLVVPGPGGPVKQIRTFGTMTEDLLALADWLAAAGWTGIGVESTGVYW